jgi:hypothetical protein
MQPVQRCNTIRAIVASFAMLFSVLTTPIHAAIFCVGDSTDLQNALTTAASNGQDDVIKISAGTYAPSGAGSVAFSYYTNENFAIDIQGGFFSLNGQPCLIHVLDPSGTKLDGGSTKQVLNVSANSGTHGAIRVSNLEIRNGRTAGFGGGLYLGLAANYTGAVRVERVIFLSNRADTFAGALAVGSDSGNIKILNNLFFGSSCGADDCTAEIIGNVPMFSTYSYEIGNNTIVGSACTAGAPATCLNSGFRISGDATANVYNNLFGYSGGRDLVISSARLYNNNFVGLSGGVPVVSVGNFSMASPVFSGGLGSFRIGPNSPFRDAGNSAFSMPTTDLDNLPRVNGRQVDIGAYEVQETIFSDPFETLL